MEENRLLKMLVCTLGIMFMSQGCFLYEVLPEETKKRKGTRIPDNPVAIPLIPKPLPLKPARLVRRLTIDLNGSLPDQKDIDLVVNNNSKYFTVAERLLNSSVAAVTTSQLHERMWRISGKNFPDLERFIADGNNDLGDTLTEKMRALVVAEPLQFIRFQYENKLRFSDIFTASYSYGTERLMDLWGSTSSGIPWTGHPWNFTEFSDNRPHSGVIGPALLATIDSRGIGKRGFEILSRFNCMSMENKKAHLFYELSASDMLTDLTALSVNTKHCADCHRPLENADSALKQLSSGSTFELWKGYIPPAADVEGLYNGKTFVGTQGWLNALKEDPRIHRCEAQKLVAAFNQRRYGAYDTATISIGLARYLERNESLRELVKAIIFSEDYRFDVVGPNITGEHIRQSSGVRNLRRFQWKSILSSLHPSLADLEYPDSLDPGVVEAINHEDMVPSGQYWASVDRLVRSAAEKIVQEELQLSSTAITRRIFSGLADGSSFGVKTDIVNQQMRMLWLRFTSEQLEDDPVTYTALQTLWAANKPEESEEKFRQAWRVILIAMLSHPRFINY